MTTSFSDGDVAIDFPRNSHGRLAKGFTDIKYVLGNTDSSIKLQTLLYTNNGKEKAELLFDRPIITISSDLNKPECRGKNVRLWKKEETQVGLNGLESADVLLLLFYTSALPEEKAHWVEEPHYMFQWLDESVYSKSSKQLQLVFSKEPSKWTRDKVFRRSSRPSGGAGKEGECLSTRASSAASVVSSSRASVKSNNRSMFGRERHGAVRTLNRFGYSDLEIKFQNEDDCKAFLDIWKGFVRRLRM